MTAPRRPMQPPPHVRIAPYLRTGAGMPVAARVVVTNRADSPQALLVTAMGLDAAWLPKPTRTMPVAPGDTVEVDVVVLPATGTLPALYPFVVTVQALDPITDQVSAMPSVVESELIVDAPGNIEVALRPSDTKTVFRRKISLVIKNDSAVPADIDFEIRKPDSITVGLESDRITVAPNDEVRLGGRIRATPPRMFGHPERHSYTVTARSAGAPKQIEGAVTTRAVIGLQPTRFALLAGFIAAWVVLAITFVPKLADNVRNRALSQVSKIPVPSSLAPGSGSGGNGSGGGSGGGPGGSGGPGGGGNNGGGAAQGSATPKDVRFNGTVGGVKPSGVTVAMQSTTLGDSQTQSAHGVGISTDALNAVAMIPAEAETVETTAALSRHRQMTTAADGAWSFAQVPAPGLYLVTFTKPGFQTQRYVIDSTAAAAAQPLKITMVPGQGTLSGKVLGPNGKGIGQAQVTISDGNNTFTTTTDTKGSVGSWSLHGLSTPDTYLVSAGKDGYGLESQLISFSGGGSASVQLRLKTGVATLMGTVHGHDSFGNPINVGGATISVTGNNVTRSATSITRGQLGLFRIPDLPTPGTYSVTVSAPGYEPQTQQISLKKGQSSRTIQPQLTLTGGVVTGTVQGDTLDRNGNAISGGPFPKVSAGLTLTSATNTYKITSVSGGSFRFNNVAPGTYLLSAEYAGLQTQYKTVKVAAGGMSDVKFDLTAQQATYTDASITGFIGSAVSPSGSLCSATTALHLCTAAAPLEATFTLVNSHHVKVPIDPATLDIVAPHGPSRYTLTAKTQSSPLTPGEYRLTVSVKGYLTASINVQVPLNGPGVAPQLNLFPSDTISGQLTGKSSLAVDPYDSSKTYVNCVWALPVDDTTTPTTCVAGQHQPSQEACSVGGQAAPAFAFLTNNPSDPTKDGTYTIGGLCDGTYNMVVVLNNPYFVPPAPDSSLTVTHGDTQRFAPSVQRLGRAVLSLSEFDSANGVGKVASGTKVSVNCNDVAVEPIPALTTGSDPAEQSNQVTVWGLPTQVPVNCTITVNDTSSPDNGKTGNITGLVGSLDTDLPGGITLSAPTKNPIFGQVVSSYLGADGVDHSGAGLAGATVTVTGPVGYSGSTPVQGTATLTTNANGCFAIVSDPADVSPALTTPPGCGPMDSTNAATTDAGSSFLTTALSVSVSKTNFGSIVNQTTSLSQSTTVAATQVTIKPTPITFAGTVAFDTGVPVGLAASATVQITPDPTASAGAGSVRAFVDSAGNIHWLDSNLNNALDQVWPGKYTISVSLPGYSSSPVTVSCLLGAASCGPGTITLNTQGNLSGTVTGYLTGADSVTDSATLAGLTNQPVAGLTVTLTGTNFTAMRVTDNGGGFSFGSLNQGTYTLSVDTSAGWRENTGLADSKPQQTITIGSASLNPAVSVHLLANRSTLQVDLQAGGSTYKNKCDTNPPGTVDGCPFVQLVPVGTSTFINPDSGHGPDANGIYQFSKVQPLTNYWVFVNDPSETVLSTQLLVYVPLPKTETSPDNVVPVHVPVTLTRNSVAGSVSGASQNGTSSSALSGVPVSLYKGAITDTTGLQVATGTDGCPLTTLTQSNGSFSFTTVANGTYTALYNAPDTAASGSCPAVTGQSDTYQTVLSADTVVVFAGQSASFAAATLPRVTATVTVTLDPTDSTDNIVGAQLELDASGVTPQTPTGPSSNQWTFNNVAAGSWSLKVTLPANHFGDLARQTGTSLNMPCTVGTSTTSVVCTSSSTFNVRKNTVALGYDVREYAIGLSVIADPLQLDNTNVHPNSAVLTVKDTAATPNTVYSNNAAVVNDAGTTPAFGTIWGRTGQTYNATATTGVANWPIGTRSFSAASTTPVPLTEIGVTLTVNVKQGAANLSGATVSVKAQPTGIGTIADQTTAANGNAVFQNIPFGTGYQMHASKTTGSGASQTTVVGDSAVFNIGAATCTGSGASTTCSLTENIVVS